jgi:mRNA interferase MazF
MKTGDIVLIPFPFAELSDIKLRPAVVLSLTKDKYKDLIVCAVSSQIPVQTSSAETLVNPDGSNGLRVRSVIKADRIFTLKRKRALAVLGTLSVEHLDQFKNAFIKLIQ